MDESMVDEYNLRGCVSCKRCGMNLYHDEWLPMQLNCVKEGCTSKLVRRSKLKAVAESCGKQLKTRMR